MTREEFAGRVRAYEGMAASGPGVYRVRVAAFASLGYFVYAGIIVALMGLLAGYAALLVFHPGIWVIKVGWKLGIPTLLGVVTLVKSLRVHLPPPEGRLVTRSNAPKLFALLDDVATKLAAPRISEVYLDDSYNAAVSQTPRWGLFGTRNRLYLGMPLLQAISAEDLKAVLGHELGHLSGNHSRFSGWVYHIVGSYVRVLQSSTNASLIEKFLEWYVPRLDALSFPLRRRDEYEADAAAARLVGRERAGQALINIGVRAERLPPFWRSIRKMVHTAAAPPPTVFQRWGEVLREPPEGGEGRALGSALKVETSADDTHPALRDRLRALGAESQIERLEGPSAAEALFEERLPMFLEEASYLWVRKATDEWTGEHRRLMAARTQLGKLERLRQGTKLTEDQAFEYATLMEDVSPDDDPRPLYAAVLELHPENPGARLALGRLHADAGDEQAVHLLKPLTKSKDSNVRFAASLWLARYHEKEGDAAAAAKALRTATRAAAERNAHEQVRRELRPTDEFIPHDFPADRLGKLKEDLALLPFLKAAYLVRKRVDAEEAVTVLAFVTKRTARFMDEDDHGRTQRVTKTVDLPEGAWIVNLDLDPAFEGPMRDVIGSLVLSS